MFDFVAQMLDLVLGTLQRQRAGVVGLLFELKLLAMFSHLADQRLPLSLKCCQFLLSRLNEATEAADVGQQLVIRGAQALDAGRQVSTFLRQRRQAGLLLGDLLLKLVERPLLVLQHRFMAGKAGCDDAGRGAPFHQFGGQFLRCQPGQRCLDGGNALLDPLDLSCQRRQTVPSLLGRIGQIGLFAPGRVQPALALFDLLIQRRAAALQSGQRRAFALLFTGQRSQFAIDLGLCLALFLQALAQTIAGFFLVSQLAAGGLDLFGQFAQRALTRQNALITPGRLAPAADAATGPHDVPLQRHHSRALAVGIQHAAGRRQVTGHDNPAQQVLDYRPQARF